MADTRSAAIPTDTFVPGSRNKEFSLAQRLGNFVSAYDTIILTSTLVFSFAVSLAAEYSSEELFDASNLSGNIRMYLFHCAIALCIGCSLHCIVILSLISYHINRSIGNAASNSAADYLENTYQYRQHARISFGTSLILFVGSLCVLYWNGLPSILASITSGIVGIFIIIIATSVNRMSAKKIHRKVSKKRGLENEINLLPPLSSKSIPMSGPDAISSMPNRAARKEKKRFAEVSSSPGNFNRDGVIDMRGYVPEYIPAAPVSSSPGNLVRHQDAGIELKRLMLQHDNVLKEAKEEQRDEENIDEDPATAFRDAVFRQAQERQKDEEMDLKTPLPAHPHAVDDSLGNGAKEEKFDPKGTSWEQRTHPDGLKYYYNAETGENTLANPFD